MFNRTGYAAQSEEIRPENPSFGRAHLLPWDAETFGFPVATYETGTQQLDDSQKREFRKYFHSWMEQHGVKLCSCAVPADDRFWRVLLPDVGFRFVDLGLRASLDRLHCARLMKSRGKLRQAVATDRQAIEDIAASAFHHGRYHADPFVPREAADLRYRHWMSRALSGAQSIDRVYVLEERGSVQGFYHFTVEDETSDLRLAAVSPKLSGTVLGLELYVSVLHLLKDLGVRRAVTSISGTNTASMNVLSLQGFRFSNPQVIYHWHSDREQA